MSMSFKENLEKMSFMTLNTLQTLLIRNYYSKDFYLYTY